MPTEKESRVWTQVICSQHVSEDVELSHKTGQTLRPHGGCHEEDGESSWAKYKIIMTEEILGETWSCERQQKRRGRGRVTKAYGPNLRKRDTCPNSTSVWCMKPIAVKDATTIPDAKTAVEKAWNKLTHLPG